MTEPGPSTTSTPRRSRTFAWTLFAPQNVPFEDTVVGTKSLLQSLISSGKLQYTVAGEEKCPSSGKDHLQGMFYFKNACSANAARSVFEPAHPHVEIGINTMALIDYCKKDGKWFELGTKPLTNAEKGKRGSEYWDDAAQAVKDGKWEEVPSQLLLTNLAALRNYRLFCQSNCKLETLSHSDANTPNFWYVGPPGSGKSRAARERFEPLGGVHVVMFGTTWMDQWDGERNLIIDDYRDPKLLGHLLIWGDRYPFIANIKGTSCKMRPERVIVTSNYHPRELWFNEDKELGPLLRRFSVVRFGSLPGMVDPIFIAPPSPEL